MGCGIIAIFDRLKDSDLTVVIIKLRLLLSRTVKHGSVPSDHANRVPRVLQAGNILQAGRDPMTAAATSRRVGSVSRRKRRCPAVSADGPLA